MELPEVIGDLDLGSKSFEESSWDYTQPLHHYLCIDFAWCIHSQCLQELPTYVVTYPKGLNKMACVEG